MCQATPIASSSWGGLDREERRGGVTRAPDAMETRMDSGRDNYPPCSARGNYPNGKFAHTLFIKYEMEFYKNNDNDINDDKNLLFWGAFSTSRPSGA